MQRMVADGLEDGVHVDTLHRWRSTLRLRSWGVEGVVPNREDRYKRWGRNSLTERMSVSQSARTAAGLGTPELAGLQFHRTNVDIVQHNAGETSLVGVGSVGVIASV